MPHNGFIYEARMDMMENSGHWHWGTLVLAGAPLHPSTSTWRWETWLVRGPGRRAWKISLLFFINFPTFCPQLQFDGIYGTRNTGAWCGHCWGFMRKPTTCRNVKYNLSLSHLACLALMVYWDQPLHASTVIEFGTGPLKTHTLNHPFITMQLQSWDTHYNCIICNSN